MNECILHYGMHKTGSSSIQDSLHASLADPRFHYVDLGRPNASAALTMAFSATPERQNMNRKHGLSRADVEPDVQASRAQLEAQLAAAVGRTAILSAEHMVFLKPAELARLKEFLSKRGLRARAVGYVRSPASYMESVFQQHIKGGRDAFDLERTFPPYRQRLGKLEAAFGAERIDYWLFDPGRFAEACVVRDFCARLGIDFDPAAVRRSNESLSLPALRLLYAYRKFGPGYGTGKQAVRQNFALIRALAALPGPKLRFHATLLAPMLERHRAETAWMEERLGEALVDRLHEDEDALRSEADLLRFEAPELEWLAQMTGEMPARGSPERADPREVARQVHVLRGSLRQAAARETGNPGLFDRLRRLLRPRGGSC